MIKVLVDKKKGKWRRGFGPLSKLKSGEYGFKVCSNCGRTVGASKIEFTENVVGKKHFHSDLKNGDVV